MKFQIGDRVRVYGANTQDLTLTGTVTHLPNETYKNTIAVRLDSSTSTQIRYHIKQCRKLRPKRIWTVFICPKAGSVHGHIFIGDQRDGKCRDCTEVVLVRESK